MNTTSEDRVVEIYSDDGTMAAKISVDAHAAIATRYQLPDNSGLFFNDLSYRLIRSNGDEVGRGALDALVNPADPVVQRRERRVYIDGHMLLKIEGGALIMVTRPASYTKGEWMQDSSTSVVGANEE